MKVEAVRPTRWTQPLELFALMAGFLFVMAAQWTPWFHTSVSPGTNSASVPEILLHGSIGITDATGGLTVPYYLGWFAVFGVCTAAVLGTPNVRALTGALGLGLIGGQALLVLGIVHARGLATSDALSLPAGVHITRSAGAYAAVVALALFALALLPAVRSSVTFPTAAEVRQSFARIAGREVRRSVVTAHDEEFPVRSGVIVEVGGAVARMSPLSAVVPAEEAAPPTGPDHSLYRRPIESTTSW